ncbi:MAG: BlaI/MecI/CopY family transcriptional regulator [Lachnospiraceae bacterium]|nr:BlaI/MecI/CopY family transcriptional regulator [Lachnospiraceae bacterium]
MELLWSNKLLAAKDIAKIIKEYVGWEKNTTYTVIKRLIDKGAIERQDPGFMCRAIVSKQTVQNNEIKMLLDKFFIGSFTAMFSEYLSSHGLKASEVLEIESKLRNYRPQN